MKINMFYDIEKLNELEKELSNLMQADGKTYEKEFRPFWVNYRGDIPKCLMVIREYRSLLEQLKGIKNENEDDIKLDYSDVLIRPKRSTLTSRYDVDMNRTFTFVHSGKSWSGIPIMASNMDTVGTPQMYERMLEQNMIITS